MFCPCARESCHKEECMFSFNDNCSLAIYSKDTAKYVIEQDLEEKLGISQINKDLQHTLTKGFLKGLIRDQSFSDEDRALIMKLHNETFALEKIKGMKK